MRRAIVLLGLVGLVAGCGTTTKTVTVTTTVPSSTTPQQKTSLRVYFLHDRRVRPVAREVANTTAVARAALDQLTMGPTGAESGEGLKSEVPTTASFDVSLANGVLSLHGPALSRPALAQVVYTLTQFPSINAVEVSGKRYTRKDFEDETPIIAVESPLPFQHVTSPLRATGTANTFEATFNYDLVDSTGKVIATHFVTATSGTGQRGTFDFSVPFTVSKPGPGKLIVYELSAANGSRIHTSEI